VLSCARRSLWLLGDFLQHLHDPGIGRAVVDENAIRVAVKERHLLIGEDQINVIVERAVLRQDLVLVLP